MSDIVRIGDATLYHADCRDIMPTLPKVDAVITDPPYGLGIDGQKESVRRDGSQLRKHHEKLGWDKAIPDSGLMQAVLAAGHQHIVWGGNYFSDDLPSSRGWLVWFKGQTGLTMSDGELAWTSLQIPLRVKNLHRTHLWQESPEHPTQKPTELMEWCLSFVPDAKTILDPFMGSGTTGVAAMNLQRSFIGIEREPKYFDIACERIERAYAQGKLFQPEQATPEQQELIA